MNRSILRSFFLLAAFCVPSFVFAATSNIGFDGLNSLILSFSNGVVRSTGYMMFTLAVVVFFWGVIHFIWNSRQGSEGKEMQKGKSFLVWGLVGIFVMFSLWGIVKFAQGVFGIQGENTIIVPDLKFEGGASSGVGGTGWNPDGTRTTINEGLGGGSGSVQTGAPCAGKSKGASCKLPSGASGTCDTSDDGVFGCYVNSGTGKTSTIQGAGSKMQQSAQQVYNSCKSSGGSDSSCQSKYTQAGGFGQGKEAVAQSKYNDCIASGGLSASRDCQKTYEAAGGTGDAEEKLAQQAYDSCISNGNSDSECQAAYKAYNGTGSGKQGLAMEAYNACKENGNSDTECLTVYRDGYGGIGNPSTYAGKSGNSAFDECIANGGDVSVCRRATTNDTEQQNQGDLPICNSPEDKDRGCRPRNGTCSRGDGLWCDDRTSENGGDWGPDPTDNEDWRTTGNGFDDPEAWRENGNGVDNTDTGLYIDDNGEIEYKEDSTTSNDGLNW